MSGNASRSRSPAKYLGGSISPFAIDKDTPGIGIIFAVVAGGKFSSDGLMNPIIEDNHVLQKVGVVEGAVRILGLPYHQSSEDAAATM